jgi:hypothetical protein
MRADLQWIAVIWVVILRKVGGENIVFAFRIAVTSYTEHHIDVISFILKMEKVPSSVNHSPHLYRCSSL